MTAGPEPPVDGGADAAMTVRLRPGTRFAG
ncbi:hypothetical protein BKA22_002008 [Cellulomonas soli]|nr:hypothetical protein [Cellulomonas soli]